MRKPIDVKQGDKYGLLTIIKESDKIIDKNGQHRRMMLCQCICGNIKIIGLRHLRSGGNKGCGCQKKFSGVSTRFVPTHNDSQFYKNLSKHKYLYQCWSGIKQRCYNTNHKSYKWYGGRGITMYEPWINNYKLFKEYILNNLGERPNGFSIDRIDNDGNYEPNNLRWADFETQNNNMSRNKKNNVKHKSN